MTTAFKTGDVVQLKSGGQRMTVACHGPQDVVICNWHMPDGDNREAIYREGQLQFIWNDETRTELRRHGEELEKSLVDIRKKKEQRES